MSIFFRGAVAEVEERSVTSLPWASGGARPLAGTSIEGLLSLVPVFAAARLISDAIAALPLKQYRETPAGGREPMSRSKVIDQPAAYGTRFAWVQRGVLSALLKGNAVGMKAGYDPATAGPATVEWLDPDTVELDGNQWYVHGRKVTEAEIVHVPAMVLPGRRWGVTPLRACRDAFETGTATQRFTRNWFAGRGNVPNTVLRNTKLTLSPEQADEAKQRAMTTMRAGEPFVTGSDWEIDLQSLPADDAGFVQSARLTATQIANIYGIPPEMIGGETGSSMTYSTTEQQQIQFLTYTLAPWLIRFEAALSDLLPAGQYVRFNVDALIRVDTKTRHEVYQIDRNIGLRSVNEIRALEDEPPLPDGTGDDYSAITGSTADDPVSKLVQQLYLGVGKVISLDEARVILKAAGADLSDGLTADDLHKDLPPLPAMAAPEGTTA